MGRLVVTLTLTLTLAATGIGGPGTSAAAESCPSGHVALTFDDGPVPAGTGAVLDALRVRGVQATFFVVGSRVAAYPGWVVRAAAEGHAIGNHTWNHEQLTRLSDAAIVSTLQRTNDQLAFTGIRRPTLVRPPYGAHSGRVDAVIRSQGWIPLLWSVDPQDWRGGSPPAIASYVLGRLHPGAVILLHDGIRRSGITAEALPAIIDGARARGFCFGVLDDRGSVVPPVRGPAQNVSALAGPDRFATAVAVSRAGWPTGAGAALLVSGERFPDALSAATLAGTVRGPLLLTPERGLEPAVAAELSRLRPAVVYVIGPLSDAVEVGVQGLGIGTVRLRAQDRYATSTLLAESATALGAETSTVLVASGTDFADALTASAVAAATRHPILLTDPREDGVRLAAAVARLGARRTIVVGGRGAVPDAAVAGLPAVERLAGGERTATAAAVATRARELGLAGPPLLVSAERFPDGLAAGVLAGAVLRAPLLSTRRDELSPPVYPWLASYGTGALTVVGGPVAVSPRVRCQIVTGFQYSFLCP